MRCSTLLAAVLVAGIAALTSRAEAQIVVTMMCGDDDTRDVATKMVNTPGYARFLK